MGNNPNAERGARWESKLVAFFRGEGFPEVTRIRGRGAKDEGDLGGLSLWAVEAKDEQSLNFPAYVKQAKQEALNAGKPFGVAIVKKRKAKVHEAYVVMDLETFVRLLKYLKALLGMEKDNG